MSHQFRGFVSALLCAAGVLLAAAPSFAASWQTNVQYGGNMPTDFYVPDNPADPAPVMVALHYCGGTKGNAQGWFKGSADQYGFIIITPQAGGNCFDATAARGGERGEIVKMVDYAVSQYNGDPSRVYAAGDSSGACMTQALLAAYPEVFAGGSSLAGVPAGAWTGGNDYAWSAPQQTAEQWGDKVRQINPDFMGPWPRVQIWHGTGDTNLTYSQTFPAETAQWTNVWGFTDADGMKESVKPPGAQNTWDRTTYKDSSGLVGVETNSTNLPHDLSGAGLFGDVVRFLILDEPDSREPPTGVAGAGGESTGGASGMAGGMSASGAGGTGVGVGGSAQGGTGVGIGGSAQGGTGVGIGGSAQGGIGMGTGIGGMGPGVVASAGNGSTSMSGGTSMGTATAGAGTGTGTPGITPGPATTPGTGTTPAAGLGSPTTTGSPGATGTPVGSAAPSGSNLATPGVMQSDSSSDGCSIGASPAGPRSRSLSVLSLLSAFGLAFRRRRR
jgi:poly(hydroxyalkanoate) depolymerase family esterase